MDTTPILTRLSVISNTLKALRALRNTSYDEFSSQHVLHTSAERDFQVAIQAALDIGGILLAEASAQVPTSYRDVFPQLAKQGLLPPDLAERLSRMAQLRNVLVHLYLEVDTRKVYEYLDHLSDLEQFAQLAADYVARQRRE